MKIILVQNLAYVPTFGGANKSNRLLAEALARRGHVCRVVATATGIQGLRTRDDFLRALQARGIGYRLPNASCCAFDLSGVEVRAFLDTATLHTHVTEQIREFQPALVIVSAEDPSYAVLEIALSLCEGRVVQFCRTALTVPFGPASPFSNPAAAGLLRRAHVVVMSNFLKDYLERWGNVPSHVLPISLHEEWRSAPENENFDAEFITMFNPCAGKGLAIFAAAAQALPHLAFSAVPTWGTTAEDIQTLRALPNVELLPPTDDVDIVMRRSRAVMVPSLWAEAMSRLITESMMRGIPVLASDVGGNAEAMHGLDYLLPVAEITSYSDRLDERGVPAAVVPPQDVTPWTSALSDLFASRGRYAQIAKESRAAALRYAASLDVGQVIDFLERVGDRQAPSLDCIRGSEPERGTGLSADRRALLAARLMKRRAGT